MQKLTNRKFTLAARPVGMPKESDFKLIETPVLEPNAGEMHRSRALHLGRPVHARPHQRRQVVRRAGRDRRRDGRRRGRQGGRIEQRRASRRATSCRASSAGRNTRSPTARACARSIRRSRPISTALGVLGMPGLDRLLRPARHRPAQAGRNRRGLRRGGRRGLDRRTDRQDQGLPRRRHRRQRRQSALAGRRAGLRRGLQLQDHQALRREAEGALPRGDRRLFRQRRRRRSPTP